MCVFFKVQRRSEIQCFFISDVVYRALYSVFGFSVFQPVHHSSVMLLFICCSENCDVFETKNPVK